MASWVEGEPDHVNEPVEDHAPAAILLSLLHGHVEPNREGGRPDPGESGTTDMVAGGRGVKGWGWTREERMVSFGRIIDL